MEQLEKDRQAEALYNVLVNPADKRLHVYDLQNLVNYYPQSSLLYLLIARSGNQEFIKSSAVYYNSKSLFRLVNDPENRPEIAPEQIIDIDHFQFNEPPPIDPLIAQNYEPTIDDLALAEINKRKFGTETEWTSYDPDETEQEPEEIQEQMYVAPLPGTPPEPQQTPDLPVAAQKETEPFEAAGEHNPSTEEESGPSDEVVRMREERRRFFQSFNASHDEDEDHLIDPFHLSATPVPPPAAPTAFEPVVNDAASWNTLNFDDADPKVEFENPEADTRTEGPVNEPSTEELAQQEDEQTSTEEAPQGEERQPQSDANTDQPTAIEEPTVDATDEVYQEIAEVPEAGPEQEIQPVAPDYQSDESWHNWDEIFEEIDEVPDPFAPVYQERTAAPVELKEETQSQEPETEQHIEPVFEETTDIPQPPGLQSIEEATDEELSAANDEVAYEEIADVRQHEPVDDEWKYEEETQDEPVYEEITEIPQTEPVITEQPKEEEPVIRDDEPVYEEITEAPKYEPIAESRPASGEFEAVPEQIQPGEPDMREMYSEIDEPVYEEITEAPKHEPVIEHPPVAEQIETAHASAEPIAPGEPERREMYSEIDEPVYDEIAESPVFESSVKSEPVYKEAAQVAESAYGEPVTEKQQDEPAEQEIQPDQTKHQRTEPAEQIQAQQQKHEEVYDEISGFDDIFFIPPSSHAVVPPVMPSIPDTPSFTYEEKAKPVPAGTVEAQPYSEDVTERVHNAAEGAPIAEEIPVPEEVKAEEADSGSGYIESETIAAPVEEQKPVNKEPITEFDGLIAENIVTADYFSFSRSRIQEPAKEEQPSPAYTDIPADNQRVSKYHDENMPYTFLWWLDKTRREYAGTYQPYAQPAPLPHMENFQRENVVTPPPVMPKHKEDEIIERFIKEEPQIKPPSSDKLDNENKARQSAEDSGELVTETLARIYTEQMLYHKAIATYKKLILRFPEKSRYFAGQIELLENKIK